MENIRYANKVLERNFVIEFLVFPALLCYICM